MSGENELRQMKPGAVLINCGRGDEMQAINKLFTPEFRNRLDAIIPFAPLSEPIIVKVVDKFL
ncbi:hypothetical protein ACLEI8_10845, partial [Neisseria gonorrhoeae]|uniref:hypothetical protein n=1 Tax=Neisseria gonorrhoeae TaxID=485 RepID=UPI003974ABC0